MSEQGWRDFLSADGIDDWVVLHGGPTAVFRVGSLQEAARLAAAVADVPGLEERTLLTAAADRLTVKLTREMWGTEARHTEVARAISKIAREHGATADPSAVQEVQLAIAAKPDAIDLGFWRAVLGYAPLHEDNCIDPLGQGSTVWMQDLDPDKPLRHAMHVDVSVVWDPHSRGATPVPGAALVCPNRQEASSFGARHGANPERAEHPDQQDSSTRELVVPIPRSHPPHAARMHRTATRRPGRRLITHP